MFAIKNMTNFQVIDIGDVYYNIFNFSETNPFNSIFKQGGHETTNFFIESGTLLAVVAGFLLLIILRKILRAIATRY